MERRRKIVICLFLIYAKIQFMSLSMTFFLCLMALVQKHHERKVIRNRTFVSHETRLHYLDSIIGNSDMQCINQLRVDRRTFGLLCELLRLYGRVKADGWVTVEEQVCMFLHILTHHVKNRTISNRFKRSGETVSRYFNSVLHGVLRLQDCLLRMPEPIPENCTDGRWKYFKNCLGALDGTYIKVRVPEQDKPRYRTRKGEIATNVLGVCSQDMKFIFVMPGWEGSASDSRILRDALSKSTGLKVPTGYYYLVDAGYPNYEGFLAPYRGTRYHLSEWRDESAPRNKEEFFNMKHSSARNVIERCFGLLKMRWAILRSPAFYPIKTQCRIITACCLLHNLIRREMSVDPLENDLVQESRSEVEDSDNISPLEASDQWASWRNDLATEMYNHWLGNRGH